MAFLSDAEAAQAAADLRAVALSQTTVKVLNATYGDDDAEGRRTRDWPDPADVTAVAGNVSLRSVRELRDDVWVTVGEWTARVPHDCDVAMGDRLFDETTGELYEVGAVTTNVGILGPLWQVCRLSRTDGSVL